MAYTLLIIYGYLYEADFSFYRQQKHFQAEVRTTYPVATRHSFQAGARQQSISTTYIRKSCGVEEYFN